MSYILDALRRAEAERQRGQVPGLGAQPAAVAADTDAPRRVPGWVYAAGTLVLAGAGAAVVIWRTQPGPAAVPVRTAPISPLPTMISPAPMAPVSSTRTAPLSSSPTAPISTVPAAAPVAAAPATPPSATVPPPWPVVVSAPPALRHAVPVEGVPAASRTEPAPTPLAALGADLRRDLPPLAVGGSIWSESAAQRFVVINGQVVHEGEAAAPGVTVERITPRTAVLRWRELRIELPL